VSRPRGELAAVFAGGAIGTLLRLGLLETEGPDAGAWPWATFAANLAGALALGIVATALAGRGERHDRMLAFAGTGICGALTTFSTVQLELLEMLDRGELGVAAGYAAASIVLGLILVNVGTRLVRARWPA